MYGREIVIFGLEQGRARLNVAMRSNIQSNPIALPGAGITLSKWPGTLLVQNVRPDCCARKIYPRSTVHLPLFTAKSAKNARF